MDDLVDIPSGVAGTLSPTILRLAGLAALLGVDEIVPLTPWSRVDCVLGWGRKANADWAEAWARLRQVPFFRLEDGFLRSLGLGMEGFAPRSVVVDDLGVYYDAGRPSRLETLLASSDSRLEDRAFLQRAGRAIEAIREAGLSKYNRARRVPKRPPSPAPRVLVVDQVSGDLSLRHGGVGRGTPAELVDAALRENPGATICFKAHPDRRRSVLDRHCRHERIRRVADGTNPIRLLQQMDRVYVMTSLLGFEGLLCGAEIVTFGCPFYAGWGLTDDRAAVPPRRNRERTLEQLFVAAYLLYSRYLDPDRGTRVSLEDVIEHLRASVSPLEDG